MISFGEKMIGDSSIQNSAKQSDTGLNFDESEGI